MRSALKIGGCALGGVLVLLIAYLALLFYPGVLFAKQVGYGNFTVYSQNDLGPEIGPILRGMEAALAKSTIADPSLKHDIFFGHGNAPFRLTQQIRAQLVARVIGRSPSLTYNASAPPYISHIVTFRIPDIQNNALVHPERPIATNLSQTLTHEVVHSLLMARFGVREIAKLPMWKQEGYADYIAASTTTLASPGYDIRRSVERFLAEDPSRMMDNRGNFARMDYSCTGASAIRTEEGFFWPTCYYISRVMMEYLFDIKGLTFDEVMSAAVTDVDTLEELLREYYSGTL